MLEGRKRENQTFGDILFPDGREIAEQDAVCKVNTEVALRILRNHYLKKQDPYYQTALIRLALEGRLEGEDREELMDYLAFWETYEGLSAEEAAAHVRQESEFLHAGEFGLFYADLSNAAVDALVEMELQRIRAELEDGE